MKDKITVVKRIKPKDVPNYSVECYDILSGTFVSQELFTLKKEMETYVKESIPHYSVVIYKKYITKL